MGCLHEGPLHEQLLSLKRPIPSLLPSSALQTQRLCYGLPLSLVQILYHDVLEYNFFWYHSTMWVLYHSGRPRAGGVDGRWLGHTWSCLQGDVFLPRHPWLSECTLLQRYGDVYTKIRAWERGWTYKGFVGLACVWALSLLYIRLLPSVLLKCFAFTGGKARAGRSGRAADPG